MKKIIPIVVTFLLLLSCSSFTAFAEEGYCDICGQPNVEWDCDCPPEKNFLDSDKNASFTLSSDYKTLFFKDKTYIRFIGPSVMYDEYELATPFAPTPAQELEVDDISFYTSETGVIINGYIYFKDGSELYTEYILEDVYSLYTDALEKGEGDYVINIWSYENIEINTERELLYGETTTIKINDYDYYGEYDVTVCFSKKHDLFITKGMVLSYDDAYYFVDYDENNFDDNENFISDFEELKAHKITNLKLVSDIDDALERSYEEDYGFFLDDDFTANVSNIFLITIFGIIPFAIFVLFLIFAIRAKKIYKKLYSAVVVLSAAELAIFIIITLIVT